MTARRQSALRFFSSEELRAIEAAMAEQAAPLSMPLTDRQDIVHDGPMGQRIHIGTVRLELWRANIGTSGSVIRSLEAMRDVLDAAIAKARSL